MTCKPHKKLKFISRAVRCGQDLNKMSALFIPRNEFWFSNSMMTNFLHYPPIAKYNKLAKKFKKVPTTNGLLESKLQELQLPFS